MLIFRPYFEKKPWAIPYYLEHTHISNCSTWAFIQAHIASFDEVF